MDAEQLAGYLRTTAPSCIAAFRRTAAQLPEPFDDNPTSVWQLSCSCGADAGRLLGYPLKDYNEDYDGPECFLSPLSFECGRCGVATGILDTDRHGYHAEVARIQGDEIGSAKLRGTRDPTSYLCPYCNESELSFIVAFVFWYPDELVDEFDSAWEELFSVFLLFCKCAKCGKTSQPTEFGKL